MIVDYKWYLQDADVRKLKWNC